MTAKQILQKKGAFKAEMDRMMPREAKRCPVAEGGGKIRQNLATVQFLAKGIADAHARQNISGSGDISDTEG